MAGRAKLEYVQNKLGYEGLFVVDPVGRSGGIALMWKEKDQADILGFSQHHIDARVKVDNLVDWRLTGVYGVPERLQRKKTWDLLRTLARDANLPWCVIGDMNNVTSAADKVGGDPYPEWLIEGFNEALQDSGLTDMQLTGHQFTWERNRGKVDWMEVRLDRALTTDDWLNKFPLAKLYNMEGSPSDHNALLLVPQIKKRSKKPYRFKFENAWTTEPMCEQLVSDGWERGNLQSVQEKIKVCSESLALWGKEITGNFSGRIKDCKESLKRYRSGRDTISIGKYAEAKENLNLIFNQREMFWRQRSKQLWLNAGDKNSRFFHKAASHRRRTNLIQKLQDEEGQWVDWETGLADLMQGYFNNIFKATESNWQEVIECVQRKVTVAQNEELLAEVKDEEVRIALFQMDPDKAPGPDGMTPGFFQKYWKIVGSDIVQMVRNFFATGELSGEINVTNIVLIPKKKSPSVLGDLRPISLCNVIVKIITKVIANRLKKTLETVISDNQSAFMAGRLISDNVMVSYEVMHFLKRKRRGKDNHMAIKLDMSKAYDRIEWPYLKAILSKLGYDDWWVHLITQCVYTVSYNITHDSRDIGPIYPTRGIRQGDPLSPYLFIICAEGLSALMGRYEQEGWIQGIRVCKRAPSISHMLFADDSYLYCKAEEEQVGYILQLLQVFEGASGQKVNMEKSVVFFSSNTIVEKKVQLCDLLNMEEADEDCKYLGLPNMMKRSKVATMGFLKDRVKKRAMSWDGKMISQGGKEVLVKAVLQSLPTYTMSVFLVPLEIIRDMERTIARFWWNSKSNERRGIHWMSWSRLCKHKAVGGMGFRDFRDFNLALLGKQGWRFLTKPNSLVSRVYKARYFPNTNFLEARLGDNPSFIWRSIMEAQNLVAAGTRWRVGSGESISILGQPWLVESENPYITSVSPSLNNNNVASLIDMECRTWDQDILRDLFNNRDQDCIKKVFVGEKDSKDELFWWKESHGHYSVRSAYRLLQAQKLCWREEDNNSFWRKIWRIKAPPKVLNLVWRSLSYCLPTTVMLQQKGISLSIICPVCKAEKETVEHVFLRCVQAVQCWQIVLPGVQSAGGCLWQWWESNLHNLESDKRAEVAAVCWSLWKARNELVWNKKNTRFYVIVAQAKQYLEQWRYAQRNTTITRFPQLHEGDGVSTWVKPQMMQKKVSVDAAIFREAKSSGIGMVARDDQGELVLAKSLYLNDVSDPEIAEGLAIKEALSWIKSQAWQEVTIESDCMVAVQAIRSKVHMISPFGRIIEDCRRMMEEQNTLSLLFIKRSANMAAHELARMSYSFPDRVFDRSFIPIGVENALKADLY